MNNTRPGCSASTNSGSWLTMTIVPGHSASARATPLRDGGARLLLVYSREDRLRLPGALLGLPPHHLGEQAQPLDLRLLAMGQRREPRLLATARHLVLGVSAAVLDQPARVEMQHTRDRRVEENEVVADHDHRAAVIAQEAHQP